MAICLGLEPGLGEKGEMQCESARLR